MDDLSYVYVVIVNGEPEYYSKAEAVLDCLEANEGNATYIGCKEVYSAFVL